MGTRVLKKVILGFLIFGLYPIGLVQSGSTSGSNFEFFFGSDSSEYQDVVIKQVASADTFILETGERIKLIGLRSPEPPQIKREHIKRDEFGFVTKEKKGPIINLEEKAFEFAKDLLEGKHVRLEFDVEKTDQYYQTLAYVFFIEGDMFVNAEILRKGFSYLQIRPPNMKYEEQLRAAYREARQEKRGIQGE